MTKNKRHPRPKPVGGQRNVGPRARKVASKKPRRRGPIVRVLPMMILVALFVLGFRVTVVVQDVQTMIATVDVGQSVAFAQEDTGIRVEEDAADTMTDEMADDVMMDDESVAETASVIGPADEDALSFNVDPQSFTPSELELLQRLSERRKVIEAQAQELETREAMLQAAEARIDGKISELQQLEQTLTALVAEADAQQQAKIGQLVRIYGAMKPKDAARIFNDLDMPILLTVVESMKESKVAPILSNMDANKATAVTEALSMRKIIPGLEGDPQG